MKNRLLSLALVLSAAMNAGVLLTFAYHRLYHPRAGAAFLSCRNDPATNWCADLRLSRRQITEFCERRKDLQSQIETVRNDLAAPKAELVRLIAEPSPDRGRIRETLRVIGTLQTRIQELVIDNLLRHKETLTPEQQRKLLSLITERMCAAPCRACVKAIPGASPKKAKPRQRMLSK